MALYALGEVASLEAVASMVGETHRHLPNPENVALYARLTPIYLSIPAKLQDEYARIAAFQQGITVLRAD